MYNEIFGLKQFLIDNLTTYITANNALYPDLQLDTVDATNVVYYAPDTDKYRGNVTIHLQALIENREQFTGDSDRATTQLHLYVLVRNDSPDNLTQKVLRYSDCLKLLFKELGTLGGLVDGSFVTSLDYFDGVEGAQQIKAVILTLNLEYQD